MHTLLVACVVLGLAAPKPKEVPKKGIKPEPIVGMWKLEKMTAAGMQLPAKDLTFEFKADGKMVRHDARGPDNE